MFNIIGADGQKYGPVSAEQLRQWIAEGRVNAQTRAQAEGSADWKPIADFPELSTAPIDSLPPLATSTSAPTVPKTNGMAITGLVMGILTWTFGLCCGGPVFAVLGIIFSAVGISQINKSTGKSTGKGMAVAGLILSIVGLLVTVLILILFGVMGLWEELSKQKRF